MLKALDSQLPRVKQALELPEPRLDQVLGGLTLTRPEPEPEPKP